MNTARKRRWSGFYFITDSKLTKNGVIEDVRQALAAGVAMVQYREKGKLNRGEVENEAKNILDMCREARVPMIVNDDVGLAKAIGADGIHLGQEDAPPREARKALGPKAIIGVSVANIEETDRAIADSADYVAVSPIFDTATKLDAGPGIGLEALKTIRAHTDMTIAAIGGINKENVRKVLAAGADLICAISASLAGGAVAENINRMMGKTKKL